MLFSMVFLDGCTKTEPKELSNSTQKELVSARTVAEIDPMTTSKVHVNNGILEFDNYQSYLEVYNGLQRLSKNKAYSDATYQELGINPNPTTDAMITDSPVSKKFENRFSGFVSARAATEASFFTFLTNGGDTENFEGSWVYDPIQSALLNSLYEIKIGTRYFKFLDKDNIAMILGGDFSKLQTLRNQPASQVKDEFNLFVWNRNDPSDASFELFEKDSEGNPLEIRGICDVKFDIASIKNNTFTFQNLSMIEASCNQPPNGNFIWSFGDGTPVVSNATSAPVTHTFAAGKLPSKVTLIYSSSVCPSCNKSYQMSVDSDCDAQFLANVVNGNVVTVTPNTNIINASYNWTFGDGSNSSSKTLSHVYDAAGTGTYTIELTVTLSNGSTCKTSQIIKVGCGSKSGKVNGQINNVVDGRTWRLASEIWFQNNLFQNTIGTYSKSYRRGTGIWWIRSADELYVSLDGDYYERNSDNVFNAELCIFKQFPFTELNNLSTNYIDITIGNLKNPSFLDKHLKSSHSMKVGSTIWTNSTLILKN
jgi:hypothetical protein